jgi:opacity protein-like surface antigen
MSSSRSLALLLALGLAAVTAAPAQSSSSSSNPAASTADQAQAAQSQGPSQGQLSVQARIKARRAQRRAAAIHEAYAHPYDAYTGMGYLRFTPGAGSPAVPATPTSPAVAHGPGLERAHEYAWNVGFTRYFDERLGLTVDGRGYYATAYVYNNAVSNSSITNPAISQYAALAGPTYRFYLQPKYSIAARVMGGMVHGNFSGDLGSFTPAQLGLWPDGTTFAVSASIPVEYNLSPGLALRVAPEYAVTGFGSTTQGSLGFTTGIVYRFGKK